MEEDDRLYQSCIPQPQTPPHLLLLLLLLIRGLAPDASDLGAHVLGPLRAAAAAVVNVLLRLGSQGVSPAGISWEQGPQCLKPEITNWKDTLPLDREAASGIAREASLQLTRTYRLLADTRPLTTANGLAPGPRASGQKAA